MDSKKAIGERLKEARQRNGMSLEDIASSTRINVKFLREIEEGASPDVPVTYLRAFLKAFAGHVELNPQELLKEYFTVEPPPPPPPPPAEANPERPRVPAQQPPPRRVSPREAQSSAQRQVKVLFVISAAMIGTLALLILVLRGGHPDRPTQEIPFNDVVKEREAKLAVETTRVDSIVPKKVVPKPVVSDSLRLDAVASESVWVHIVIDNAVTREYVLTPKRRLQWKGKTSFVISVGNASAISLVLNGVKLEPLGIPQRPANNVILSRETLRKHQNNPSKKVEG